ncbi:NACHT domain-containing protein [Nocardia sp. NPDC055165]
MRGNTFDNLPDPAKVLTIITLEHSEVIDTVAGGAPRVRPRQRVGNRIVPGIPMLALLMVAVHEFGAPATKALIAEAYRRTRRDYLGIDSLSPAFKYRSEKLGEYFRTATPPSADLIAELLAALAPSKSSLETLGRLLSEPDRRHIPDDYTPDALIRSAIQAELDAPDQDTAVRIVLNAIADQLDTAPITYPPGLTPTALAPAMTVSELGDQWLQNSQHTPSTQLYATISRNGGQHALDALASCEHAAVVLLGNPGSGKTTILAALTARRIRREPNRPTIHIRLPDLASVLARPGVLVPKSLRPAAAAVVAALTRWHRHPIPQPVQDSLRDSIVGNANTLLALDSWDEVTDSTDRAAVRTALEHLSRMPGHIVVSSRITGYDRPLPEQREFLVDELTRDQADAFFESWFTHAPGPGAERVAKVRRSSREIRELITIPLMAGLVAYVAQADHVPTRKHALYQRYITRFLQRQWKPAAERRTDPVHIAQLENVATEIAWGMATAPAPASPLGTWRDTASVVALLDHAPGMHHKVSELIHADGLLTLHGQPDDRLTALEYEYRWLHRTIHEHLSGRRLARMVETDPGTGIELCKRAILRPEWQTTLEHAIGLLHNSAKEHLFDELEHFAEEGDPADYIRTRIDELAPLLDPHTDRARTLRDTALTRSDYRTAFRIDPQEVIRLIRSGAQDDWEAIGDISQLQPDPTEIGADILENIAIRGKDASNRVWAVSMLTQSYPKRALSTVIAVTDIHSYPISLSLNQVPADAVEWILEEMKKDWTRSYHMASIFGYSEEKVLAALPSPILQQMLHTQHRNFYSSPETSIADHAGAEELIKGERGPVFAYEIGKLCRLTDLEESDPWAKVGYWQRSQTNPVPPGHWDDQRAIAALETLRDLSTPADPDKIIEASQAIHWIANGNAIPATVPILLDIFELNRVAFDFNTVDITQAAPALLVTPAYVATKSMSQDDYWLHATKRLTEHGWNADIVQLAPGPADHEDQDYYLHVAQIIHRSGAELPSRLTGYFGYADDRGRLDISEMLTLATSSVDRKVGRSIVSFAAAQLVDSQREIMWPKLVAAYNGVATPPHRLPDTSTPTLSGPHL